MENKKNSRDHSATLFIGKFSESGASQNKFASAAGDLVQQQIIYELKTLLPTQIVHYISMEPNRVFPGGNLFSAGAYDHNGEFIPYINLPIVKNIIYAIKIFRYCLRLRPGLVIQYNSYLFENISILLYRYLFGAKVCQIVQDVRVGAEFSWLAREQDRLANKLLKRFDYVLPITQAVADKFMLDSGKYHIFHGGVTRRGFELAESKSNIKPFAVFAGALERHNGVDKLIRFWNDRSPNLDLHIFGRGSLASLVAASSIGNQRIKYHGFQSQDEIMKWQRIAKFNFCFRYSDGLQEDYFFPSKFFDLACAPGLLIVNKFKNLPIFMMECDGVVDSIDELEKFVLLPDNEVKKISNHRRALVLRWGTWNSTLRLVVNRLEIFKQ